MEPAEHRAQKSKYERAWENWTEICTKFRMTPIPADPFNIAVYFNHLLSTRGTKGSITDAMYGFRWGHIRSGHLTPTDQPFTKLAYDRAILLSNFTSTKKKEPFTVPMLHALVDANQFYNLIYFSFVIICLLGFTIFMRLDEILNVKVENLQFHDSYLTIDIPKCKNDQTREGNVLCCQDQYYVLSSDELCHIFTHLTA